MTMCIRINCLNTNNQCAPTVCIYICMCVCTSGNKVGCKQPTNAGHKNSGVESKLPSNKQHSAVLWPKYPWVTSSIWSFINSSWIRSAVPFEHIAYCSCWLGYDWCAAAFWLLYSPLPRNHQNSPHELSSTHSKASRGEDTDQSNANSQPAPVTSPQKGE